MDMPPQWNAGKRQAGKGEPEHRSGDAQIKGGLSKVKTGSSGGKAVSQKTRSQVWPGGTMR